VEQIWVAIRVNLHLFAVTSHPRKFIFNKMVRDSRTGKAHTADY